MGKSHRGKRADKKSQGQEAKQDVKPSRRDALLLVVTVANICLLAFLIPSSLWKNEKVDLIMKIVPSAASAFAAGYLWISKRFLSFLKSTAYMAVQLIALGVLFTLHVTQLPIVFIRPTVQPSLSRLSLDGGPFEDYDGEGFRVSISNHTVNGVSRAGDCEGSFDISYGEAFFAFFKEFTPLWQLNYDVTVDTAEPHAQITITKTDAKFDTSYRRKMPREWPERPPVFTSDEELTYKGADLPQGSADKFKLPYGNYKVTKRVLIENVCDERQSADLIVGQGKQHIVEFEELCVRP